MGPPPTWAHRALRVLLPVVGLLLAAQYLLGLWTNVNGPSAGFTSNTSFPALDWHYNIGFALGIVALIAIVLAALTRSPRNLGMTVIVFLAILVAGIEGMRFVSTSPNDPNASFAMGAAFLVAMGASQALAFLLMRAPSTGPPATPAAPGTA